MTTLQDLQQTISRFVKGGRKRRQLKRELAQLAAMGELDAVLADVGLVRSQVEPLIAGSSDTNDRLDKMLDHWASTWPAYPSNLSATWRGPASTAAANVIAANGYPTARGRTSTASVRMPRNWTMPC